MIRRLLAIVTGPWRRAREHAEAVALAADLDLERVFAEMRADLEHAEVAALVDARAADGTIPPALEGWARSSPLEAVRAFVETTESMRAREAATPGPAPECSLEELLASAARAVGVSPAVYVAASLGRVDQWSARA